MFGRKKTLDITDQVETLIGQGTSVTGSLSSNGALRIDGQFEGDIATSVDIIVGESGRITATVSAKNAVVAGLVTGNMDIVDKLELLPSAKVVGDLKVGTLIIGEGAVFKGNCEMRQSAE
jgi:cytoskeletal protein CcmA (bactofilin family)